MSFLLYEAGNRLKKSPLVQLNEMIDWNSLRTIIGDLGRTRYGPSGYDPIKMVKAIILQAWHSLSDPGLEEALRVRLDFMVITGLTEIPDETTICRFRNLLVERGLLNKLLSTINAQLEEKGLKVRESQGAILDATIIRSAARPQKEMEAISVDRQEDEAIFEVKEDVKFSKDPDATWLKKGNKSYFGYKGFILVDQEDGYIEYTKTTPAHMSEIKQLDSILSEVKQINRLYADKGYASQANKDILKQRSIKNALMEKAKKNKPLTKMQKTFNRMISKTRYKVEQAFGTLKRRFNLGQATYMTCAKVHAQLTIKAIAFNLLKALNKFLMV